MMTDWTALGHIEAGAPTLKLWADPHFIYRIITPDGRLTAAGTDVARQAGVLVRRMSAALPVPAQHVRTAPLSDDVRRAL